MNTARTLMKAMATALLATGLLVGGVMWWDQPPALALEPAAAETPDLIERGRYLALAGNCAGCHTARGGAAYAGGRALATPFGNVYAGNLTPDARTGIGSWNHAQFWRAMHHGISADGRRLIPAFPYTEFTRITRADSNALFAYLRSLPAVAQPNPTHELRWPYGTPLALAAWRTAFFRPAVFEPDTTQTPSWNRGAYLVNGLGHCAACHGRRNALGAAEPEGFRGGQLPMRAWHAPALTQADEAGVADWPLDDIAALLRTGRSPRGWASGPMAEVVARSTQHLDMQDTLAMAEYLQKLPPTPAARPKAFTAEPARAAQGAKLYDEHCAQCHGAQGEGGRTAQGEGVVPALAGNRLVSMNPPANLVRAIALGGYGAPTATHPRPFGMPPFAHVLKDDDIGAVATFLRAQWGHQAAPVSASEVARWRGGADD
jgi:mono/diheme cytochrome c family protein